MSFQANMGNLENQDVLQSRTKIPEELQKQKQERLEKLAEGKSQSQTNVQHHGTPPGNLQQQSSKSNSDDVSNLALVTEIITIDSDDEDELISVNCNSHTEAVVRKPMVVLKEEEIDGGDSEDDFVMDSVSTAPLPPEEEKTRLEKTIVVARGNEAEEDSSDGFTTVTVDDAMTLLVPVRCMLCKITFLSIAKLEEHVNNQHSQHSTAIINNQHSQHSTSCEDSGSVRKAMYTCCFCSVSMPPNNINGLASHIVSKHKDPVEILDRGSRGFKCPFCVCSTNLRKNMIQHVSAEHLPKPYQVVSNMAYPLQSQQVLPPSSQPFQAPQPVLVMQLPQQTQIVSGNLQQAVPLQQPLFFIQQQQQVELNNQLVQQPVIEPAMQMPQRPPQQQPTIVRVESGRDVIDLTNETDDDDVVIISN